MQTGTIDIQAATTFNTGSIVTGTGLLKLSNGGTFNGNIVANNNLQFAGGTFNGAAPAGVTIDSNLLWTGGVITGKLSNGTGDTLTANTNGSKIFGGTFTNQGIVNQSGSNIILNGGGANTVTNAGNWNLQGDFGLAPQFNFDGGTFTNTGTLAKTAGTGSSVIGALGLNFVNSGKVDVQTGAIQIAQNFNNQGNIHVANGATLVVTGANFSNDTNSLISGQGTIDPLITLINSGVIQPGENGLGTLHLDGNYQQSSTSILDIGIGGSDSLGVLDIQGNATWGGTLKVTSLGGFMPTIDELFTVALFSGTFTGQFASLDTSAFSGMTFSTIYGSKDLSIKVTSVNAVPLPAGIWLFGSALAGLVFTGRRKNIMEGVSFQS